MPLQMIAASGGQRAIKSSALGKATKIIETTIISNAFDDFSLLIHLDREHLIAALILHFSNVSFNEINFFNPPFQKSVTRSEQVWQCRAGPILNSSSRSVGCLWRSG